MKNLNLILILISTLFLVNCSDDNKKSDKFIIEGTYIEGVGSIDGFEILSFDLVDNFETIDIYFNTGMNVTKCTYSLFEDQGDTVYFVSIPETEQSSLVLFSIEDISSGSELKTLGERDFELTNDICQKVEITNAFKNVGINVVQSFN